MNDLTDPKYTVVIGRGARKALAAIDDAKTRARVALKIEALGGDPRPPGSAKLKGSDNYRVRQGTFRIIYSIDDGVLTVEVIDIGHRRDVYR